MGLVRGLQCAGPAGLGAVDDKSTIPFFKENRIWGGEGYVYYVVNNSKVVFQPVWKYAMKMNLSEGVLMEHPVFCSISTGSFFLLHIHRALKIRTM